MGNETTQAEQAIFDAALTEFAARGKDGARMQDIADRAGMNKAMLHYYYRSKDKLYEAVLAHVLGGFMGEVSSSMDIDAPFPEQLRTMIATYTRMHYRQPDVCKLWLHENLNGAPVARDLLANRGGAFNAPRKAFAWIEAAVERGDIRPVDPLQFMFTFIGAVVIFLISRSTLSLYRPDLLDPDPVVREQLIEERIDHLFNLFYHGLQPR
ncbi:MAG: TetR family transcriptional regulator [Rhodothermales bacterium]